MPPEQPKSQTGVAGLHGSAGFEGAWAVPGSVGRSMTIRPVCVLELSGSQILNLFHLGWRRLSGNGKGLEQHLCDLIAAQRQTCQEVLVGTRTAIVGFSRRVTQPTANAVQRKRIQ